MFKNQARRNATSRWPTSRINSIRQLNCAKSESAALKTTHQRVIWHDRPGSVRTDSERENLY